MWGEESETRENELKKDIFFKPGLENRARMARHENTVPSAEDIILLILDRGPLPLHMQTELVNEGKGITKTSAGQELNRELNAEVREHKEKTRVSKERCSGR